MLALKQPFALPRTAATSKMERFVEAVNYHKALHLECCSSSKSASDSLFYSEIQNFENYT